MSPYTPVAADFDLNMPSLKCLQSTIDMQKQRLKEISYSLSQKIEVEYEQAIRTGAQTLPEYEFCFEEINGQFTAIAKPTGRHRPVTDEMRDYLAKKDREPGAAHGKEP